MAIKKETIRAVVLFTITVVVLGAYVLHRRSAIQTRGSAGGAQDMSDKGDPNENSGGEGGQDSGGPGEGEGGEGGQGEGPGGEGMGAEPGMPDPDGQPGEHGPRSHSICIKRQAPGTHHFQVSGKVTITNPDPTKRRAVTTVVAVDKHASEWGGVNTVKVFESVVLTSDVWQMDFRANQPGVQICAIQTSDYQEFTYVHVAGCLAEAVTGRAGGAPTVLSGQNLNVITLSQIVELIGFSSSVPRHAWPGTTQRRLTGQVVMDGHPTGRFLIATAAVPILEQAEDAEGNPNGLYVTGTDGRFDISLLSPPGDPQFVCALGLPPKGTPISTVEQLTGRGCVKVQVPAPTNGVALVENVRLVANPAVKQTMTAHEKEHFTFLDQCLSK